NASSNDSPGSELSRYVHFPHCLLHFLEAERTVRGVKEIVVGNPSCVAHLERANIFRTGSLLELPKIKVVQESVAFGWPYQIDPRSPYLEYRMKVSRRAATLTILDRKVRCGHGPILSGPYAHHSGAQRTFLLEKQLE